MIAGVPDTFTPIGEPPPDPDFDSESGGILSTLAQVTRAAAEAFIAGLM